MTKEVIKDMDKWIPAKIDGKPTASIARILLYPDDLFENYKKDYVLTDYMKPSTFDIENFRKEVVKKIDFSDFGFKGKGTLKIQTTFYINQLGELENLEMVESSGLKEFDEMILGAIKRTIKKTKVEPARIHDYPIRAKFRFPIAIPIP
ncbi:energy transducer TonB [Chryseobacterium sp.]|uniref:energy transducer TonB n=1 Tax=Chryseobacterium sp. TaxID=1871047 RepID=UPI0011DAEBB9|nr:energy transducer TonB [Chryseobacterium sp.]TXF75899.1 energy transducer TonB [Chryseobacterium sp.]